MARPKLGAGKIERVPIMMPEEDIKAVDDWQFARGASSRSEAIRALIRYGIAAERQAMIQDLRRRLEQLEGETDSPMPGGSDD